MKKIALKDAYAKAELGLRINGVAYRRHLDVHAFNVLPEAVAALQSARKGLLGIMPAPEAWKIVEMTLKRINKVEIP